MKKIFTLLTLLFSAFCTGIQAQVISLGSGFFTGTNAVGPVNTSSNAGSASRYAYIYPASLLGKLKHGDSILSISFHKNGGGPIQGNCNMKIYIRTTVNASYGLRNINWVNQTAVTGMTKVYDKDPRNDIDTFNSVGWRRFRFSSPYVVDTVLGKNLELLIEYTQVSAQMFNTFWSYETGFSIFGFTSNQTKFVSVSNGILPDTTRNSSDLHPSLRIEFPRLDYDISLNKLYSLGKLPIPQGNPDTVRAILHNVGKKDQTFKVFLRSKGANNLLDSLSYTVKSLEERVVNMPLFYPSNKGLDTLIAFVKPDSNPANDSTRSYRLATEFVYSYKDPTLPVAGGIGFGGSTGDFVAKFYSSSQKAINQISVSFSGSNQKFKLGIWDATGTNGKPGTLLWESDTLNSSPTFITAVDPYVYVNGNFYVGVRQIGLINVGFGYQPDVPARENTFFYTVPIGSSDWTDFAPDAPFKFVIEPRLQAEDDVAPLVYNYPTDTLWLINSKTMAPKATIKNYGTNDQNTAFNVSMRIQRFNNQEFFSTKSITLGSGDSKVVTFDSSFFPQSAGQYDIITYTRLGNDQMKDNDTLKSRLIVAAFKDVGPATIFDPSSGMDYEQYMDTVFPAVYVQNYGLDAQGSFNVRAEIYDSSGNLVYSDVKAQSLTALNSVIVAFKPYPCDIKGEFHFRAFTELGIDVDKTNDTVRRSFKVVRSNDVAITSITYPKNGAILIPPVAAKRPEAVLENVGDANQASPFSNHCEIYYNNILIYKDSVSSNSFRQSPNSLLFKNFQPVNRGYYRMLIFTSLYGDQNHKNDTMVSIFSVGILDDVELVSFNPADSSSLELSKVHPTSVTIRNNGDNAQNTAFPIIFKVSRGIDLQYIKVIFVSLDSGETKTIDIDTTLALHEEGEYEVLVYSALAKDFRKSNDTLSGVYFTRKSFDLELEQILFPLATDTLLLHTQYVEPRVRIKDRGDSVFNKRFKVFSRLVNASSGVQLYMKSIDTVMTASSDSLDLKFPGFTLSTVSIDTRLECFIVSADDQFELNDSAFVRLPFRIKYDAKASRILMPANNAYIKDVSAAFAPQLELSNEGISAIPGFNAILLIKKQDTVSLSESEVYRDTVYSGILAASEVKAYTASRTFDPALQGVGVYKAYLNVFSQQDQIFSNNAFQSQFRVYHSVGLVTINGVVFKVYPNPSSDYLYIETDSRCKVTLEDVSGKIISSLSLQEGKNLIDTSSLSSGLYFINTGNGLIKFVVE